MSFMEAVKSVFSKYATFSGRARRSEYWYFTLFNFIISLVLSILFNASGLKFFQILSSLWSLAVLVPGLAVAVRRLHDIGKPGPWILIALVPIVGWILLIVWYCKDSDPGENDYGPNPKESTFDGFIS